jgi:hypothetical protein
MFTLSAFWGCAVMYASGRNRSVPDQRSVDNNEHHHLHPITTDEYHPSPVTPSDQISECSTPRKKQGRQQRGKAARSAAAALQAKGAAAAAAEVQRGGAG